MDFRCTAIPNHRDNSLSGGAADDGIVNNNGLFPAEDRGNGVEFDPNPQLSHSLGRLNKGAPDIAIADNCQFKGVSDSSA